MLEAADLDNCGWWAKVAHVIVPMIRPTLLNLVILSFIGKMKIFDLVWIMTRGGPLWSTETVSTYVYKRAFEWNTFDLGYPSAVAVVWFVVVIGAVLVLSWRSGSVTGSSTDAQPPAHSRTRSLLIALSLYTAYAAGPFLWIASMSLRTTPEIFANPYGLPLDPQFGKYVDRLDLESNYGVYFSNSTLVVAAAVAILTIVGAMAAHCAGALSLSRQPAGVVHRVLDDDFPAADHDHRVVPGARRLWHLRLADGPYAGRTWRCSCR